MIFYKKIYKIYLTNKNMDPKEKILVLATTFPRWENDKEPTFVKDLCKELIEDFEVHVLVPHYKGLKPREKVEGMFIHRFTYFYPKKLQKLAYGGILPNIKKNPILILQSPLLFTSKLYNTIKIIKKYNIKKIHTHWFFPQGYISAICNKLLKTKSMVTIHAGGIIALNKIPLLKKPISNFIVKNNDIIISVSHYGKDLLKTMVSSNLKKMVENKTKVIPMGTYTKEFRKKINKKSLRKEYKIKERNIILFLGRIAEKKGLKYLIQALPKIKNKDYLILIGGDGPLKKNIELLVKKYKFQNKVRFLGYITGKDKTNYILSSDILIVPSIVTKEGDTEGLPVTIMEGMSAGLPTIATDVGGIKDIIKNNKNGLLIKQKNPKEIAEKINYLLKNKKIMKRISTNAKLTGKNYDWKNIGIKNIELIKKLK